MRDVRGNIECFIQFEKRKYVVEWSGLNDVEEDK